MQSISGYGRELFVSNVIGYIGTHYPAIFQTIFSNYLPSSATITVKREWQHTDIAVFIGDPNKPHIIIENKIGAAIIKSQLKKYSDLIGADGHRILLSLRKPINQDTGEWQYMSYEDLAERLAPCLIGKGFEFEFLKYFCEYLKSLHNEIEVISNDLLENLDSKTLKEITQKDNMRPYEARMIFEILSSKLEERIKGYGVSVSAGITHSTPMLQLVFDKDKYKDKGYVVQLQDNYLVLGFEIANNGLFTYTKNDEKTERTAKRENRAEIWDVYAPEALKKFTNNKDRNEMSGYTTEKYIMPTIRFYCGDKTIEDVFNDIEEIVKDLPK